MGRLHSLPLPPFSHLYNGDDDFSQLPVRVAVPGDTRYTQVGYIEDSLIEIVYKGVWSGVKDATGIAQCSRASHGGNPFHLKP